MGNLIKEWVKGILTEDIKKEVVVYAGRFQPFHKGHYGTYQHLVKKFGKDNVYHQTMVWTSIVLLYLEAWQQSRFLENKSRHV